MNKKRRLMKRILVGILILVMVLSVLAPMVVNAAEIEGSETQTEAINVTEDLITIQENNGDITIEEGTSSALNLEDNKTASETVNPTEELNEIVPPVKEETLVDENISSKPVEENTTTIENKPVNINEDTSETTEVVEEEKFDMNKAFKNHMIEFLKNNIFMIIVAVACIVGLFIVKRNKNNILDDGETKNRHDNTRL